MDFIGPRTIDESKQLDELPDGEEMVLSEQVDDVGAFGIWCEIRYHYGYDIIPECQ